MANEITVTAFLKAVKGEYSDQASHQDTLDMTGAIGVRNVQTVGFAAHEALVLGDVTTCGWAYFKNTDATNYVQIGVDTTGTFRAVIKLKPGEGGVIRLATNAPYAQAAVAAVNLHYWILQD